MRDPLHWLDVQRKLVLTFVGVCLLAFGVGGSLAATSASSALEEEILLRLRYQCRTWADALDGDLRLLTRRCEDFASDGWIRECASNASGEEPEAGRVREELRRHLATNKLPLVEAFENLAVLDAENRVVVTAAGEPPYVDTVVEGARQQTDRPWQSGLLGLDATDGVPVQAIVVPLRSLDGKRRIGSLAAWVRTGVWVSGALRSVEPEGSPRKESIEIGLADRAGREVAVPRLASGGSFAEGATDLENRLVLRSSAPEVADERPVAGGSATVRATLAANGWTVRVRLHSPEALAPVSGLQSRFLLVGMALATAIGVLLLFPMRFLARPLVRLREAAKRLEAGDMAVRVPADTEDEIGDLTRSFNHMAEAVASRTRRLEEAARELAAERDRLDAVITHLRDGLVVLDADGKPVLSNSAAGPLLRLLESRDPRVTSRHECGGARAGKSCAGCLLDPARPPRSCVLDADGRVYEVHVTTLPPAADGRCGRVLLARDVTDRVVQDEREIHQERLSVLGEVAAVMAHELNNPLATISLFSQRMARDAGSGSPWTESLDAIRRSTEQCKRAIRELLDYATGAAPEIGDVDLHATVEDVARFLRPLAERSQARISLDLRAERHLLTGDEIQIRQVLVNLVVNALQAMEGTGGEVTLATHDAGGHVEVDVSDTGPGVPDDLRPRIFDPFFTTKRRGAGTGLGLSTARRIAELHGGGLDLIESHPGRTVFRVRLRAGTAASASAPREVTA